MGSLPAAGLLARKEHALAYDSTRQLVVLFGGEDDSFNNLDDTWEYDGSSWTRGPLVTPGLRGRQQTAMAFDAARGRMVMFGGTVVGEDFSDTWEYDGSSWDEAGPTYPQERYKYGMAYDSWRGRVIVFGGDSNDGELNDVWEFDGQAWAPGPPGPPQRSCQGSTWA